MVKVKGQGTHNDNGGDGIGIEALARLPAKVEALEVEIRRLSDVISARIPQVVSVAEAAKALGVSQKTVRRRIETREWPHVRIGGAIRVDLGVILGKPAA